MHCFRVVLGTGGECVPVSPRFQDMNAAIEHYDYLTFGLGAMGIEGLTIFISEYNDIDGLEYAVRDFEAAEMDVYRRQTPLSGRTDTLA